MKYAIVMAAGKGTRMNSNLPKVMHKVCQTPMIEHILDSLTAAGAKRIISVVGYGHEIVEKAMEGRCEFALQEPQLGTGHAVMQARQLAGLKGKTLVVNGDAPCLKKETLIRLYDELDDCKMVVLSAMPTDPRVYGRIVKDENGFIKKIVEYKDADDEERLIKEINTGIYGFDNEVLFECLKELKNDNAQKEYYITDLVAILLNKGYKVKSVLAKDNDEVAGVNDRIELEKAGRYLRKEINERHMRNGVTLINAEDTYISKDVKIGKDVIIYPNVFLEGNTVIGDNNILYPQTRIVNGKVGNNCVIDASHIIGSEVKDDCKVGPYAHFRMNTVVESKNRIGNFVEFKNTRFGYDSRCAHLTYLGDSDVGSKVNMGCGVVTVNYDGKNKHKTVVKDGAFIGSNVNLIAPITVGENSVVAAGSTVNKDINDGEMAIARVRQENKPGYGLKYKNK